MKTKIYIFFFIILPILSPLSCSEDTLQVDRKFPPNNTKEEENPSYPLNINTHYWYSFSKSYIYRDREVQSSGNICIQIDSIDDKYTDNGESKINTQVRVNGSANNDDIIFSDSSNPNISANEVDDIHSILWIQRMLPKSGDSEFLVQKSLSFRTRKSLAPPDQNFNSLPFFDPRRSKDSSWGGFSLSSQDNYYMKDINDIENMSSDDINITRKEDFPSTCLEHETQNNCQLPCFWDRSANDFAGACVGEYSFEIAMRYDLGNLAPSELQGTVIHSIGAYFTSNGILHTYKEYIVPDNNNNLQFISQCPSEVPCATANVSQRIESSWNNVACSF